MSDRMWRYTQDGAEQGPASHAAMCERFARAELPLDTPVWEGGLPASVPASEVEDFRGIWGKGFAKPSATPPPLPVTTDTPARPAPRPPLNARSRELDVDDDGVAQVRPWVRYWARAFDMGFLSCALTLAVGVQPFVILPALIPGTLIANALQLSFFGTTLGKMLLGTSVEREGGGPPTFGQALRREWLCLFKGQGLGVPVVNLFTMVAAYGGLVSLGTTSWDEATHLVVRHRRLGFFRWAGYWAAHWGLSAATLFAFVALRPGDPQSQEFRATFAALGPTFAALGPSSASASPSILITRNDGQSAQPAPRPVTVVKRGKPKLLTLPSDASRGKGTTRAAAATTRPSRRLDRPAPGVTFKPAPQDANQ